MEQATGINTTEYAVIGGGTKSNLWCKVIADMSGKHVFRMSTDEASSLGATITEAVAAGWYTSFTHAAAGTN